MGIGNSDCPRWKVGVWGQNWLLCESTGPVKSVARKWEKGYIGLEKDMIREFHAIDRDVLTWNGMLAGNCPKTGADASGSIVEMDGSLTVESIRNMFINMAAKNILI